MNRRIRNIMAMFSFVLLTISAMALARPAEAADADCPKRCVSTCGSGLSAACRKCGLEYQADGCYSDHFECPDTGYEVKCIIPEPD